MQQQMDETILVVEDEAGLRHILDSCLRGAGYGVLCASSAEEARMLLAEHPRISMMLLDVGLPGMTGLDLARQLHAVLPHFPFLMLTANDDPGIVAAAIEAGALSYLVKPVDVRQLLPAVRAALARYRDMDRLRTSTSQLQEALEGDRSVSVAVGLLMYGKEIDQHKAFELLRTQARQARSPIGDVARKIIKGFSQTSR